MWRKRSVNDQRKMSLGIILCGTLFQNFNGGQNFSFEKLQECAAAGGDIRHFVADTIFGDRGERIAAAVKDLLEEELSNEFILWLQSIAHAGWPIHHE